MTIFDIDPLYSKEEWANHWERERERGHYKLETMHQTKDGRLFPVEVAVDRVNYGDKELNCAYARDITERKQAEAVLRESEARWRSLVESAPAVIMTVDAAGRILTTNRTVSGGDITQVVGTSLSGYLRPEDQERVRRAVEAVFRTGAPQYYEIHGHVPSGGEFWFETHLAAIRPANEVEAAILISVDITERKQAEEKVRRLNEELEQRVVERTQQLQEALTFQQEIMTASSTGIVVYDAAGQCVLANEAAAKTINTSLEQVLAQNYHRLESWQRSGLYATALEAVETGLEKQQDVHVVSTFGKEVWLNCRFVPFDSGGQPHLLLTVNDMTERMRTETEIRELNRQLQTQASNLIAANQELEAFSYSVSHDLRAPLRAVNGYTHILVEDYESALDAEGKQICARIHHQTQRMDQLIDDLLTFSRLSRVDMRASSIDMEALTNAVFQEVTTPDDRERIDFQLESLPPAVGDPALIRQVWINLLANAVKFSAKREQAVIEVSSSQEAGETIYFVHDNGAGFEMQYADKLFGVFQRLHSEREFEGTGVGLAIIQRIIHRHGGRVWAEGAVDKGATFYFTLPQKEDLL